MEISPELWYLLPVSIIIAMIAMSSGIGGAVFFSPLFMLGLKLDPTIAVGTALITELFGFSSGLIAYVKTKLIDYKLGMNLLMFSVPFAILGSYFGNEIPPVALKAIFGAGIIFIGVQLFSSWRKEEREKNETEREKEFEENYESCLIDNTGKEYKYTICNKDMGRIFAAVGGAFVGMISVGLAELQEYHLVAKCKVPPPVAVATSVFVVVITVFVASLGHIYKFTTHADKQMFGEILSIIIFTAPGVIIGGQLGPMLQKKMPEDKMKVGVSLLFILVGGILLFTLAN
ncbi:MAG: sulfite exporter TauE/SafE family protein [Chlorobi bacterium]|nr:sulfite exporter TauE/SafE family protein [Chlorobiota bacterium]